LSIDDEMKTNRPLRNLFLVDILSDKDSRPILIWAGLTLLFGMFVYHWLEGWSYLDALYFSVISLATVGYGDLTPTTPLAKGFTIFYIINGIGILLGVIDRIRIVRSNNMVPKIPEKNAEVVEPIESER
jgi:voltage-gated potassium channel